MAKFIHGNQSIHYELAGVREFRLRTPVLLLHGNGEDMHIFDNMIAPLLGAKGFVLMDSRMQGESFSLDGGGEISYSAMADDAAALMDELGINEYDIVGYSDGGIIALLMAMKSFKVRRFFTIGANTDPSGLTAKAVREIKTALRRANHKGDERTAALLSMMLNEPHITSNQLAGIIAEATIILGKKDTVIDRKHSERIADAIPHGTHVLIEGAGHDVPVTHPGVLSDLVRTLL